MEAQAPDENDDLDRGERADDRVEDPGQLSDRQDELDLAAELMQGWAFVRRRKRRAAAHLPKRAAL